MERDQLQQLDVGSALRNSADVLVIGAGVSGIQASLDLAENGFKVYLVDKAPAIGGKMAQLDKTFPTLDCSMCIESPKFIEVNRHPNIEIVTYCEVDKVEGEVGDFRVTLVKKPRYVAEDRCRGCGTCTQYCPVQVPDEYNQGLSSTRSIHVYFPQAVPLVSHVDPRTCAFLVDGKCNICVEVCQEKAVDFSQREEKVVIRVGAIILAPGYEVFDPGGSTIYGYGMMSNVITSLDFERVLCASGPFQGELVRPFDGRAPQNIAWIQCVGSRRATSDGGSYCSAVCCTYAAKQVVLAKERGIAELTVFHNDIRPYGKDFERFWRRAASLPGVRYVRSFPCVSGELAGNRNVAIRYGVNGAVKEEEFDLVVLSVGMAPPRYSETLAERFSIKLNRHGFCETDSRNPMETSRAGIFASGAFLGPMDIPDSIVSGSAASARCSELLRRRRGKLAMEKTYPPERDVSTVHAKVGVFVCHCGTNIARVVDISSVVEYASGLENVIYAEENLFACSADAARHIAEIVREKCLNRVVVAACTPRTHEPLFQDTLREAGVNKYLFVMANIREHCSWVHSRESERATEKAKDIIRMAVARAIRLEPLQEFKTGVKRKALVVGGGLAGMISALSLANQGVPVALVEKTASLGGMARRLYYTLDGMNVQRYLEEVIRRVYRNPLIEVFTEHTVIETSGHAGNFNTRLMSKGRIREIDHGASIIATGAEEYKPVEYSYARDPRVLTLLELEERIEKRDPSVTTARSLAMILCVGSREEDRPYCSRVCCNQAIKCALRLKEANPAVDIFIFYRDMVTYGFAEDYYREAANQQVKFIRYDLDNRPHLEGAQNDTRERMRISVRDDVLGESLLIDADIVALATAALPSTTTEELRRQFRLPLSQDGFFLEAHVKLRPVEFATEGVYLCGMAHYPKSVSETILQAYGCAARAAAFLSKGKVVSSGAVCEVSCDECLGCGRCEEVCPYGAIRLHEVAGGETGKKAILTSALCKGCGTCTSLCPTGALSLKHFTDHQILSEIDAAFSVTRERSHFEPKILAFLCNWCGYAGSDLAGVSRIQYAPNIRIIRVMCSGRVHPGFVYEAFLRRMDGVMVFGCHPGTCHYISGINQTVKTMEAVRKKLEEVGIDLERLRLEHISAAEGARFAEAVNGFAEALTRLGRIELSREQIQSLSKSTSHIVHKSHYYPRSRWLEDSL